MTEQKIEEKAPEKNEPNYEELWKNPMKRPRLEKIVLNIGVGSGGEELERASTALGAITGKKAVKTNAKLSVKEFNIREGKPIGTKVTIRGEEAVKLLKRLLIVYNNQITKRSFDNYGNFGFGIKEHIMIPQVEYDNTIGIFGLDVCGRIIRPGLRVKSRKGKKARVNKNHYVSRDEAQYFLKKEFNVQFVKKLDLDIV